LVSELLLAVGSLIQISRQILRRQIEVEAFEIFDPGLKNNG